MPQHQQSFFQRYVLPALIGLAAAGATGAFTLAWNLNTKMAVMEQRQYVKIEEFATARAELQHTKEDLARLREWVQRLSERQRQMHGND